MARPKKNINSSFEVMSEKGIPLIMIESKASNIQVVENILIAPGSNMITQDQYDDILRYFDQLDENKQGSQHLRGVFVFRIFEQNEDGKINLSDKKSKMDFINQLNAVLDEESLKTLVNTVSGDVMNDNVVKRVYSKKLAEIAKMEKIAELSIKG